MSITLPRSRRRATGGPAFAAAAAAALVLGLSGAAVAAGTHPSATALKASRATAVTGQSVTFTASVPTSAATAPTGSVTFKVDGVAQPAVALTAGKAVLKRAFTVGNHSVEATYGGDATYAGSSAPAVAVAVGKAATVALVSSSANPGEVGRAVKFQAKVNAASPGKGVPTGTVTFTVDGVAQPAVALVAGTAKTTATFKTTGSHPVSAAYSGDANYLASTSAAYSETVNPAAPVTTTTKLYSSLNPSTVGRTVTFLAKIQAGTGANPTGTVTFTIDGVAKPAVAVASSKASYTTAFATAGAHTVSASYSGAAGYRPSTAPALTQNVS
ncbi:MAG: hypothetical protein JWN55_582 [Frankiales bacterium]|nr:hypothetical protein [Frankiales bacterium]